MVRHGSDHLRKASEDYRSSSVESYPDGQKLSAPTSGDGSDEAFIGSALDRYGKTARDTCDWAKQHMGGVGGAGQVRRGGRRSFPDV